MNLIILISFLQTGLFAVGGGLVMIPFVYDFIVNYTEINIDFYPTMIAIVQSLPSPNGILLSSLASFMAFDNPLLGAVGALIAAVAVVVFPVVIILVIARHFEKFKAEHRIVTVLAYLRPVTIILIVYTIFPFLLKSGESIDTVLLTIMLLVVAMLIELKKLHPILLIASGAVLGYVFL